MTFRGARSFQEKDALDRALLYPFVANEPLDDVQACRDRQAAEGVPATIEPGMRAISVQINDSSGVAGLIQPNSRVDVLFTRPGSMAEAVTSVILQNVKVSLSAARFRSGRRSTRKLPDAGRDAADVRRRTRRSWSSPRIRARSASFCAIRSTGRRIRTWQPVNTDVLDPMISARMARARRGRTTSVRGQGSESGRSKGLAGAHRRKEDQDDEERGLNSEQEEGAGEAAAGGGCFSRRQARAGNVPMRIAPLTDRAALSRGRRARAKSRSSRAAASCCSSSATSSGWRFPSRRSPTPWSSRRARSWSTAKAPAKRR